MQSLGLDVPLCSPVTNYNECYIYIIVFVYGNSCNILDDHTTIAMQKIKRNKIKWKCNNNSVCVLNNGIRAERI